MSNDTNSTTELFIHDRTTKETSRVCFSSEASLYDLCSGGALSGDGRYVVFHSAATDLVENDTNDSNDIFIYDRMNKETSLISVSFDGVQGQGGSLTPDISEDGRFVSFVSSANNLTGDDAISGQHIYVRDRTTGSTSRVSVSSDGDVANNFSFGASINANGRYIAFISLATNLVENDTNEKFDIFVHDRVNGETIRIETGGQPLINEGSLAPKISPDGGYVVFFSRIPDLVDDDTNSVSDVFIAPVNF